MSIDARITELRSPGAVMSLSEAQATVEAAAEVLATSPFLGRENAALIVEALTTLQIARNKA